MSDVPPQEDWPEWVAPLISKKVKAGISAKKDEIVALKNEIADIRGELTTAQASAQAAEAIRQEFDAYKGQIEQDSVFRSVGLALDGLEEDSDDYGSASKARARLLQGYRSDIEGEEDPPSLAEWMAEVAPNDPVYRHVLPAGSDDDPAPRTPSPDDRGTPSVRPRPRTEQRVRQPAGPQSNEQKVAQLRDAAAQDRRKAMSTRDKTERADLLKASREKLHEAQAIAT